MPSLRLTAVQRWFGEDPRINALTGVDLTVQQGEFVAIEGPSGSGKSTLLNQLALVDRPNAGQYCIDDVNPEELSERQRARLRSDLFGFVFQRFHLMPHRTALENVEVGLLYRGVPRASRRTLARAALQAVGLGHRQDVAARKLSGGEQQRVAIARAAVAHAPVLIADEPTGNLDSETGAAIVEQIRAFNDNGTTVVLVTHDAEVAAHATRRVRIKDGTVLTDTGQSSKAKRPEQPSTNTPAHPMPGRASSIRALDIFRESWHALRGRPGRSAVLISAVGIAVALVVVTLGLSQTASAQVSTSFDVQRNREVTIRVPLEQQPQPDGATRNTTGVPVDVESRLRKVNGVVAAGVLESHDPTSVANLDQPSVSNLNLVGISPGLINAVDSAVTWAPGHGRMLGRHELLLGTYLADKLQIGPLQLDPTVQLADMTFAVVGIITSSARAPELTDDLVTNWQWASEISALDSSTVYITTLGGAAQQVARQAPIAIDSTHADTMDTQAPPDPFSLRASIQGDVTSALLALTIVASLASILSVANAMLLSVLERIGEFGLRRAIGARPTHILGQTSVEAMLAGLLGGLVGLATGLAVILAATVLNHWQPVLDLRLVPLAVAGGTVVGVLGGLPASIRASRIQPADALRR